MDHNPWKLFLTRPAVEDIMVDEWSVLRTSGVDLAIIEYNAKDDQGYSQHIIQERRLCIVTESELGHIKWDIVWTTEVNI